MRLPARRVDALAVAVALLLLVLVAVRALTTVDPYWDTLQYHWPYAARAAGLCDAQCLTFPPGIELRYAAFPMLFHLLFGWLWRLFGTPAAGHLLGLAMLACVGIYLRVRLAVPLAWSWLAFLAIPLVQVHVTSSYADLTANAALTLALLVAFRLWLQPAARPGVDVALALAALTLAAGTKLQMIPVALLAWLVVVIAVMRNARGTRADFPYGPFVGLPLLLLGGLCLTPQLVLNVIHFGNPFYPVEVRVGHWLLAGPETMRQAGMSIGDAWVDKPGWVRWLASVLEFDAFGGRSPPWTVDQGDVPFASPAFRMGGYFAPYVLALFGVLAWRARAGGVARRPLLVMLALSVLCALLPLAHELRYYLFWMLMLVAMALASAFAPALTLAQAPPAPPAASPVATAVRAIVAVALASVTLATGAVYLRTRGAHLDELVARTDTVVAALPRGATLCVAPNYRDAILYTSLFHPGHDLHVRAIPAGDTAGCTTVTAPP